MGKRELKVGKVTEWNTKMNDECTKRFGENRSRRQNRRSNMVPPDPDLGESQH